MSQMYAGTHCSMSRVTYTDVDAAASLFGPGQDHLEPAK